MKFRHRLSAVVAAGLASMALLVVGSSASGSAEVCPDGRTWIPATKRCDPPPPVPAWYQVAPSYAQSWAPAWAPPPPPAPPWAVALDLKPVWDPRQEMWTWIYVR
jgi:hypothetical protein